LGWIEVAKEGAHRSDEDTQQRLAGRRYRLLPTPPDLLAGVPWHADSESATALMLAGDLAHIAFSELVSLIAHTRTSGALRVMGASGTRTVIFADGEVRGATSVRVGERLGEVAARMGLIKLQELDAVRDDVLQGRRAGRIAVERGMLSERDLWNAMQEHAITIFQSILLESRGVFLLTQECVDDALTVPGLPAEALLMEGVRRLDEMRAGEFASGRTCTPERVLAAFNGAFRDIFATADQSGAGAALRSAAANVFEEEPSHQSVFRGIAFSEQGELPEQEVLKRASEMAKSRGVPMQELLFDALTTAMLFLLFVAGEHLEQSVNQALHSRVKAAVTYL
jgi:hypothetical protein